MPNDQPRVRLIFTALLFVLLLAALDQTHRLDRAADDRRRPRRDLDHLSWVVTAYLLTATITARCTARSPTSTGASRCSSRRSSSSWSARRCCGLAQNMAQLIAFRALQGLGGGGLMVADARRRRRHHPAARARPVPGLLRRGVRRLDRRRAAARRLLRRQPLVALDLLRQPARSASVALSIIAVAFRTPRGRTRGTRSTTSALLLARGLARLRRPLHEPRRNRHGRGARPGDRADRREHRAHAAVRSRRGARRRADPAAVAVPQPHLLRHERDRLHRRLRDVRRDHVPPALPAGDEGLERRWCRVCSSSR